MASYLPINIKDLLYFRGVESTRVELKRSWNEETTGVQVLRTICAFANDLFNINGGYIVIGVAEENGTAVMPPVGLMKTELEGIQKWIRGQCRRLNPEYQPLMSPEEVDGKNLLVIWVPASDTRPHQAPAAKGAGYSFYVRIGAETVDAKGQVLTDLLSMTAKVPFDDRRAPQFTLYDLRATLVREFLHDVRSGLLNEKDDIEVYRRMRLSARTNGHEVPRNVALLFFSDDPEQAFLGARIEVVHFTDDTGGDILEERIFRGPLHRQTRDCLDYLSNLTTSHSQKLADQATTKGWVSYPFAALEESLVNAIYHRSYDATPEPTKVYLYPDRVEITSYPGPVPGLRPEHFRSQVRIPNVPARNRRIGELLKELRLAEARGTGVPKVFRAMQENQSPPPRFEFDESRTYFTVVLPAHPDYSRRLALRDAAMSKVTKRQPAIPKAVIQPELRGSADAVSTDPLEIDQIVLERAIKELEEGRLQDAHHSFETAQKSISNNPRFLYQFARTKLEIAISLPETVTPTSNEHELDARNTLLRAAQKIFRTVQQQPAPENIRAFASYHLGRAMRALRSPESRVRAEFQKAADILPDEPSFQAALSERSND